MQMVVFTENPVLDVSIKDFSETNLNNHHNQRNECKGKYSSPTQYSKFSLETENAPLER